MAARSKDESAFGSTASQFACGACRTRTTTNQFEETLELAGPIYKSATGEIQVHVGGCLDGMDMCKWREKSQGAKI